MWENHSHKGALNLRFLVRFTKVEHLHDGLETPDFKETVTIEVNSHSATPSHSDPQWLSGDRDIHASNLVMQQKVQAGLGVKGCSEIPTLST